MDLGRRDLLKIGGLTALSWLLPGSARAQEAAATANAKSLIVLWLNGGPSQLDTFDPKPGTPIGGQTRGVKTKLPGILFSTGYERLADRADKLAVLRSVVTKEGEHLRGTYLLRTGTPLLPTVTYPSIGAVVSHELEREQVEIPKHVALLSDRPPRGGFLGPEFHAFRVGDPKDPLSDLVSPLGKERFDTRLKGLNVLEKGFARGRAIRAEQTQHGALSEEARKMMASPQVKAFDYRQETAATISAYGDSPFGRSCLVARRLVEIGVPAIEVSLGGWDTHAANFEGQAAQAPDLDRGFSALLDDLEARNMLDDTLIVCGGEFGRTPRINALEGRDHWTRGFSILMAGGGLRVGQVIGETDPAGEEGPTDPVSVPDLFATIYSRLNIDGSQWFESDQGRPAQLNNGKPIKKLLRS